MESEDGGLEDGEIVDYTPLERPSVPSVNNFINGTSNVSSDDASLASSETEEDSDTEPYARPKKRKLTKQRYKFSNHGRVNKYNVWSIGLQEEALSETLVNCDVEKIDRSRSVESYDYQMKYRLDDDQDQTKESDQEEKLRNPHSKSNKRHRGEYRLHRHSRLKSEERDKNWKDQKQIIKRMISDLSVSDTDSPEDVAKDICTKLSETKEDLILRAVVTLGNKKAIELYNETKRIEEDGGMMVMNGSRRRTPGGVFFLLVKRDSDIPPEKTKLIFIDDREMTQQFRRKKKKTKSNGMKKTTLGDELLPNLLTRSEQLELRDRTPPENEQPVTNPPPSPATDCDGADTQCCVPPHKIVTYDDDFLQLNADDQDMEMF